MRYSESEIVEDVLEHIRKTGGEFGEWCMGTARDTEAPIFRQHVNDGLISRAAYTHYAAEEVLDRLKDFGMRPDSKPVASASGTMVFVYRAKTASPQQTDHHASLHPAA